MCAVKRLECWREQHKLTTPVAGLDQESCEANLAADSNREASIRRTPQRLRKTRHDHIVSPLQLCQMWHML